MFLKEVIVYKARLFGKAGGSESESRDVISYN